ncbi:MAG: prepilin-type N-terminal cleavage/methylation domain-containing protein [SAR324 cluster bacterium]|nr:prepilin-type N-terminal cleavage/methylation domain-containing protein [SAR324 cluster bacterium]
MMRKFTSNRIDPISPGGFSLLEVIIAIALLSVIMSLLYNAFFQISDSTKKVARSLEAGQELRLLMKIVLDDLQAVQYLESLVVHNHPDNPEYFHTGLFSRQIEGPNNEPASFVQFHAAIPTRFFPEAIKQQKDPELHELEYYLEIEPLTQKWQFIRREDFYVDSDITEGGVEQVLSESIVKFDLEYLEQNILKSDSLELQEVWVREWDSQEGSCSNASGSTPCLPLAIRLTMSILGENDNIVTDTLQVNLPIALQK